MRLRARWGGTAFAAALGVLAAGCGGPGPIGETTLELGEGSAPGTKRALLKATPGENLTNLEITFRVPPECQVIAGAQQSLLPEWPAGKTLERSLEMRCGTAAAAPPAPQAGAAAPGKVAVAVAAKDASGQPVRIERESSL